DLSASAAASYVYKRQGQTGVPCQPLFFPYRMLHGFPSFLFAIYFDIKNQFILSIIANRKSPFYSIRTQNNPFRHLFSKKSRIHLPYGIQIQLF
ncbi:hypothetical protein BSR42_11885, partial [Megasphaera cerevisiae]